MALFTKQNLSLSLHLTLPNILSLMRIILTPFLLYFWLHQFFFITAILLLICLLSDFFDGLIARKFQQISELGKVLDPIADKVFTVSLIIIIGPNYLSRSLISLLIILELLLAFSPTLNFVLHLGKRLGSNVFGKIKMSLESLAIILMFLDFFKKLVARNLIQTLIWLSIIFAFTSLLVHLISPATS